MRRTPLVAAAIALSFVLSACREAAVSLGPTPAHARDGASSLLGALAARFGPITLDSSLANVRPKITRSSLVPSRIYNDSAMWSARHGSTRVMQLHGVPAADEKSYDMTVGNGVPSPARPGEYRRDIQLTRLTHPDYEWRVRDDLAVGSVRTADLTAAITALYSGLEQRSERDIRSEYRTLLPRAAVVLGRLFTLDTIRLIGDTLGGTTASFTVTIHPRRVAATHPAYARYLEKYVSPARYHILVTDRTGAPWWEASAANNVLTLRLRVRGGSLAPFSGSPRRMPDSLRVRVSFLAKVLVFRVGMRGLVGDVTLSRLPHELGYTSRFRREPEWVLPPLVERLIRSPLRRPFEGEGLVTAFAVRDSPGAQTLLTRDYAVTVRESAIVRWFGGIGNTAVSDFRRGAEREADSFNGEALRALQADVLALLGRAVRADNSPH